LITSFSIFFLLTPLRTFRIPSQIHNRTQVPWTPHHHRLHHHRSRTPSSLLAVPDHRSRRPAHQASSSSSSSRGSSRPQRAAKIQANHNLDLYNNSQGNNSSSDISRAGTPASGQDEADEADASGEEDNTSNTPFFGRNSDDSEMSPLTAGSARPSLLHTTRASTSEPSFADSPLPASSSGAFPDELQYACELSSGSSFV